MSRPVIPILITLKKLGLYNDYVRKVDALKAEGIAPTAAHSRIRKEYTEQLTTDLPGGIEIPDWVTILKRTFKKKPKISHRESVDWAMNHVLFRDIKYNDAPSALAWLYIIKMRMDDIFLKDILKKRVPNISKIESSEGIQDDGREQITLIEKLEAEQRDNASKDSLLLSGEKKFVSRESSIP